MQQSLIDDDTCHFLCLWLLMLACWSSIPRSHFHSNEEGGEKGRQRVSRMVEDCFDHLCLTVSGLPIPSSANKIEKETRAREVSTQEHAIYPEHLVRFPHTLISSSMLHETCQKDVADCTKWTSKNSLEALNSEASTNK